MPGQYRPSEEYRAFWDYFAEKRARRVAYPYPIRGPLSGSTVEAQGPRVAVVHASHDVAVYAARVLRERAGLDAVAFREEEGLEGLRAFPPSLLIVSDEMERHDWQGFVRACGAGVRVLVMTYRDYPDSAGLLHCPAKLTALLSKVRVALGLPDP